MGDYIVCHMGDVNRLNIPELCVNGRYVCVRFHTLNKKPNNVLLTQTILMSYKVDIIYREAESEPNNTKADTIQYSFVYH